MDKMSFLSLFMDLYNQQKTGVLKVSQDQLQKSIFFKKGKVVFIDSSLRSANLGRILVDNKRLTEEQFEAVVKRVKETGKRQGEVLVEIGLMSAYEIFEALKDQLAKKLLNCFLLKDFKHEFLDGEQHLANITEIPINIIRVIMDGVQTCYTYEVLKEEGGFTKEMIPFVPPAKKPILTSLELRPDEQKLVRMFDGNETLFNIVKNSAMEHQLVLSTVFILKNLDLIDYLTEPKDKPKEVNKPQQKAIILPPKPKIQPHEEKPDMPAKEKGASKPPVEKEDKIKDEKAKTEKPKEEKPAEENPKEEKPVTVSKDSPIYSPYLKLDTQGYLELFGLSVKFKKEDLKKNYDDLIKRYNLDRIDQIYKDQEKEMAEKILNKVITAFTILKDEKKKDEYLKIRAKILKPRSMEEDKFLQAEIEANKAAMYKKKNNLRKAEESLKKAVEFNPNEIEYLVLLADLLMGKAQLEKKIPEKEVEEFLKKALSIDQNNYNVFLNLGVYYKLAKERNKAVNCFNKTLELNPSNSRANAELRLFNIRGEDKEKKPLFSFFTLKPKKEKEDGKKKAPDDEEEEDKK